MLYNRIDTADVRGPDSWGDGDQGASPSEALELLLAAARRQWKIVAVFVVVAVSLAAAYIATAVPLYTSTINIIVNENPARVVSDLADPVMGVRDDSARILSEVEILRSEKVAMRVVDVLDLSNNPVFMASDGDPIDLAKDFIRQGIQLATGSTGGGEVEDDTDAMRLAAMYRVLRNTDVSRVGQTFVLSVSFTFRDPELAATISRTVGEAYLAEQLEARYAATRSASDWLQKRIADLKKRSIDSDIAVQRFKVANGLIAAQGSLVSDQNLSQLNTRLVEAQAATAQAEARYERIQSIIEAGDPDAVVSDALDSSLINQLRTRFLEASKREAEISEQLGPEHISATRLRAEMSEYRRLIFEELRRIADSYKSEVEVARLGEQAISRSFSDAMDLSGSNSELMVQLRELEREAETYRALYQSFLQRYQEAVQQESFPVAQARIITEAKIPNFPSHPRNSMVMALAVAIGLFAGAGVGAVREFRDRFFRTGDQVREELGLSFLGSTPMVSSRPSPNASRRSADHIHPGVLHKVNAASSHVLDHPLSQFAETMRSAKLAADVTMRDRKPKIIGVTSIIPGEGKSTVSINFAEMLASMGIKTLLIDGDLRRPGLTKAVASHAREGLVEALVERREMGKLLLRNPDTGLSVLPAFAQFRINHTSELLASDAMSELLEEAGKTFEYVVIDLPPIAPVIDARAISSKIDGFILVVEWGKTSRKVVKNLMRSEPLITERCLGVVLNKVDPSRLKYYAAHGTSEYYSPTYRSYYRGGRH